MRSNFLIILLLLLNKGCSSFSCAGRSIVDLNLVGADGFKDLGNAGIDIFRDKVAILG